MSENMATTALKPSPPPPPAPLRPLNNLRHSLSENSPQKQPQSTPEKVESQVLKQTVRNVPHVHLNTDRISPAMAARLATSLFGHVLFLKSQVPFPVMQLSRMSSMQSESKAAKKRMELISAVDTLASHMQTTFMALSAAFALKGPSEQSENSNSGSIDDVSSETVQMMFVVGPSVGAAKAKVAFIAEGLEVKPRGLRVGCSPINGLPREVDVPRIVSSDNSSDSEEEDSDDNEDLIASSESDDKLPPETSLSDPEDDADDCEPGPPLSRSPSPPSPSTPPQSCPSTPPPQIRKPRGFTPLSDIPVPQDSSSRMMPPPKTSYAEEQDVLRAADRLLSRTLANACAEDNGSMASELSISQTHVLLRAPRRFEHPAWTPRQNLTRSLEASMQSFIHDATTSVDLENATQSKKKPVRIGVKTEGVWISCRASSSESQGGKSTSNEEDELIWWQWNGKIAGFSEW